MVSDTRRLARANETPIVDGLPDQPGILAAMHLSPAVGEHLRGLANALLFDDFPGSTLSRGERELLATTVSAGNDCFFCMDSHAAFALELLHREKADGSEELVEAAKEAAVERLSPKLSALVSIARQVGASPRSLSRADVVSARQSGATSGDVQLAVLIAAAFCMYNRMVDGLRAKTPFEASVYAERALAIADHGYSAARVPQMAD
jgi:uncharacterized peroxidase-related enzyme